MDLHWQARRHRRAERQDGSTNVGNALSATDLWAVCFASGSVHLPPPHLPSFFPQPKQTRAAGYVLKGKIAPFREMTVREFSLSTIERASRSGKGIK
jgi:hypothetical protein